MGRDSIRRISKDLSLEDSFKSGGKLTMGIIMVCIAIAITTNAGVALAIDNALDDNSKGGRKSSSLSMKNIFNRDDFFSAVSWFYGKIGDYVVAPLTQAGFFVNSFLKDYYQSKEESELPSSTPCNPKMQGCGCVSSKIAGG